MLAVREAASLVAMDSKHIAIQAIHSNSEASKSISTTLCCLRAALDYMDTCFYTAQVSLQLLLCDKTFLIQRMYNGKIVCHILDGKLHSPSHACAAVVVLLAAPVQQQFSLIAKGQRDCQYGCPSKVHIPSMCKSTVLYQLDHSHTQALIAVMCMLLYTTLANL